MKTIKKDDYEFLVDIEKTIKHYDTKLICNYSSCLNFSSQIKESLPELNSFLCDFGVDVTKPDEITWWTIEDKIDYTTKYTVTGKIKIMGQFEIDIGLLNIVINSSYVSNEHDDPYFSITVYNVHLPWIQLEPFPYIPLKESIFIKLMKSFKKIMKQE